MADGNRLRDQREADVRFFDARQLCELHVTPRWRLPYSALRSGGRRQIRVAQVRRSDLITQDYILVVDDDPGIRLVLTDLLEDEGFAVRVAVDGEDALRYCETRLPMLLITDLEMPHLSGVALIRELDARKLGAFPVIIISGKPNLAEGIRNYADHLEPKPMDLERLLRQVRGLLERRTPSGSR